MSHAFDQTFSSRVRRHTNSIVSAVRYMQGQLFIPMNQPLSAMDWDYFRRFIEFLYRHWMRGVRSLGFLLIPGNTTIDEVLIVYRALSVLWAPGETLSGQLDKFISVDLSGYRMLTDEPLDAVWLLEHRIPTAPYALYPTSTPSLSTDHIQPVSDENQTSDC